MTSKKKSTRQIVYEYLKQVNKTPSKKFWGYYIQGINEAHPMAGLRRLRDLKFKYKLIDYRVIDSLSSTYQLLWIKEEE